MEAEESWDTAFVLLENRKYDMAAFCFHLAIEKFLKACWVKNNMENYPPRLHNLIYLQNESKLELPDDIIAELASMNSWNIIGRYPDYITRLNRGISKDFIEAKLSTLNTLKQCLLKKLQ